VARKRRVYSDDVQIGDEVLAYPDVLLEEIRDLVEVTEHLRAEYVASGNPYWLFLIWLSRRELRRARQLADLYRDHEEFAREWPELERRWERALWGVARERAERCEAETAVATEEQRAPHDD